MMNSHNMMLQPRLLNGRMSVRMLAVLLVFHIFHVRGWTSANYRRSIDSNKRHQPDGVFHHQRNFLIARLPSAESHRSKIPLFSSQGDSHDTPTISPDFSSEELIKIESIFDQCQATNSRDDLQSTLLNVLPTLSPLLLLKVRQAEEHPDTTVQTVSKHVNTILEQQLDVAKTTLSEMLNAGEIRKLDSLIGKAARDRRLDTAFFNVLTINLKDAKDSEETPTEDGTASRHQILTHIYTRCQEEAEKNIPPGTALLNKLLRTQEASIRKNLYEHYLTPQPSIITAPDGSTVDLGQKPVLVSLEQFTSAIDGAVLQIRNVETAGGFDRESAAMMVESCRQVAKEARIVIGESYGIDSAELRQWEDTLQPVFRPKSPRSPYIKGEFET